MSTSSFQELEIDEQDIDQQALLPSPTGVAGVQFINDTIATIGYGPYQQKLFFLCGLGWLADNMWIQVLAVSLQSIQDEFRLSQTWSGIGTTATMTGMFLGSFIWGGVADKFGRKFSFFYTLLLSAIFGTLAGFALSINTLCFCLFVMGLGVGGSLPTDGSLFLEFVPKERSNMLVLMSMFWPAGQVLTSAFAWIFIQGHPPCPDKEHLDECLPSIKWGWRFVVLATGLTTFGMFVSRYWLFDMIESPKFLFKRGKASETFKSLEALASYNNEELDFTVDEMPPMSRAILEMDQDDYNAKKNKWDSLAPLFTEELRTTTFLIWAIWMLSTLAFSMFYAFLPKFLEGQRSVFSPQLDFVVISLFGIPGSLIATKAVDTSLGRKGTMMYSTLFTSFGLFAFVTFTNPYILLFVNCIASLSSNIMWAVTLATNPAFGPPSIITERLSILSANVDRTGNLRTTGHPSLVDPEIMCVSQQALGPLCTELGVSPDARAAASGLKGIAGRRVP